MLLWRRRRGRRLLGLRGDEAQDDGVGSAEEEARDDGVGSEEEEAWDGNVRSEEARDGGE